MTVRVLHALPAAVIAAAGLTACTTTEAGEPVAIEPPTTERLAPPIDQPPLDVEPFLDRPCDVLTPDQAAERTVSNPERVPDERAYTGPACEFQPDDPKQVFFRVTIRTTVALESVYQRRDTLQLFEPTEVTGYPGVFNDSADRRSGGNCGLTVGVAEDTALDILVSVNDRQSPEYTDPCPVAARIMQQMIETIGAAS
ncbi:MAG: DUF3558 domain-containing protein [Actinobacteria bacterium]|nr:DUF3558 domain-containing protein [Actinomycetota bacterium]